MAQIIAASIRVLVLLWSAYIEWWTMAAWAMFTFLANYHHIRRIFIGKGEGDGPSQDG